MSSKFNISEIFDNFQINMNEKAELIRLFEFTQYLYGDDSNLTKTSNLTKKAKDQLIERIQETFEINLSDENDNSLMN